MGDVWGGNGGRSGAVHRSGGRNGHTDRGAVPVPYELQAVSDEKVFSDKDMLYERRGRMREGEGTISDGPIQPVGDRAEGEGNAVPCDIEHGRRVFVGAVARDHGGKSVHKIH